MSNNLPDHSKENLDKIKLAYVEAATWIDKSKEPSMELMILKDAMTEAEQSNRCGSDPAFATFLYEDLAPGLAKRLPIERSTDDKYLDLVAQVMHGLVRLLVVELQNKRYSYPFYLAMIQFFKCDTYIHKYFFQMPEEMIKLLRTSNQTWRKELEVDSMVDLLVETDYPHKCNGWLQAKIVRVVEDKLFLEVPRSSNQFDCQKDRWSTDIAIFESKTKADYEWREKNLIGQKLMKVDLKDSSRWLKSTLLETRLDTLPGSDRKVEMAKIGLRIYTDTPKILKGSDEIGTYEGYSSKQDEWVPIFSPRIQAFMSRVDRKDFDDYDMAEEYDDLISPPEGMTRVYVVPRVYKCTSSQFLNFMNDFGNRGGFDMILDVLENASLDENGLDITLMGCLASIIAMPYPVYHKNFIKEFGERIANAISNRLILASDKSLRDIRKEQIDAILGAVDSIRKRFLLKDQRELLSETLKLELSNKCLQSSYLERRIQGIKDLNSVIRNCSFNWSTSPSCLTLSFLLQWMQEHDVFNQIWDAKKTHLQLVQRSNEIFKLLLKEKLMTNALLKQFWDLTKSDYKTEVIKIVGDSAFYFEADHVYFLFEQIASTPGDKLGMSEFDCLCDLGKMYKSREGDFQSKVCNFFWSIILDSGKYKAELVDNCIKKFSEMVKYWTVENKAMFFEKLTTQLQTPGPIVPIYNVFKKLVTDEGDRTAYSYYGTTNTTNQNVKTYTTESANGQITSYSYTQDTEQKPQEEENIYSSTATERSVIDKESAESKVEAKKIELSLKAVLNKLQSDHKIVSKLLENLKAYCATAYEIAKKRDLSKSDYKKLSLVYEQHTHVDEIQKRLGLLQFYAAQSDAHISKAELKVIYDLLSQSPLAADVNEFLIWLKEACASQTTTNVVFDMKEVGEFFSELVDTQKLNVATLPLVGFQFLQNYFVQLNEQEANLVILPKAVKKVTNTSYGTQWKSIWTQAETQVEAPQEDVDEINFRLVQHPDKLQKLEMIWQVVLESENPVVTAQALRLLNKVYTCLNDCLLGERGEIQQKLISKCFEILNNKPSSKAVGVITKLLNLIIQDSEKKGTGDVQPHNAILKGELLTRIVVKSNISQRKYNTFIQVFSSTTVWEFRKEVGRMVDMAPRYIEIKTADNVVLDDSKNGHVLAQIGIKSGDVIQVRRVSVDEDIMQVPLTDATTYELVPAAHAIFNEWYDMYSSEEGVMTPESTVYFIKGSTGESVPADDSRIKGLFASYDADKDGKLDRQEFLRFYQCASKDKPDRVYDNIRMHLIRNDLKKLADVEDEAAFDKNDMPRYTISHNQHQFQTLMNLLDRNDETSSEVWDLIRTLATNEQIYKEVLSLDSAVDANGKVQWESFFENKNVYRRIYNLEIIEAVMEEGEKASDSRVRIIAVDETEGKVSRPPSCLNWKKNQKSQQSHDPATDLLKQQWTKKFIENQGFNYVFQSLIERHLISGNTSSDQQSLKHTSFLLLLLRVFLTAAFSTDESTAYSTIEIVRKSSSNYSDKDEAKSIAKEDNSSTTHIRALLENQIGLDILYKTDFSLLQNKLLVLISHTISKDSKSMFFEDKLIVENSLNLMMGCILFKKELFADFLNFKGSDNVKSAQDLILKGVLFCPEEKIRENFKLFLFHLSKEIPEAMKLCLTLLSENFSLISNYPCRQFFDLFNELIDDYFLQQASGIESDTTVFDPEQLLSKIIDKIRTDQKERKDASVKQLEQEDDESGSLIAEAQEAAERERLMIGLIELTGKIVARVDAKTSEKIVQEQDLVNEIFREFLFASVFQASDGSEKARKIVIKVQKGTRKDRKVSTQANESRAAAYKLLNELIKKSPVLLAKFFTELLMPLLNKVKKPTKWNFMPSGQFSSSQKYCGLKNLGCICYMNSMMQQFFMMPALRYNLLTVDDGLAENFKTYKGEVIDDNMLHQMQRLIAHLELSERQDYNPLGFCFAFKEFDGNPTNTSEQKDAQEFLNVLFDRLDNALKPTPKKYLLQSIFGGKTCSQMICSECGKTKNRVEDYYNLSITVKEMKSVYESLFQSVQGEIISDFTCSGCKKKVDISKRTLITETPNVLVVHLQRIVFNFDTFNNDKLNSFMEFPQVLDLKPYSYYDIMEKEGRLPQAKSEAEDEETQETASVTVEETSDKDPKKAEEEDEPEPVIPQEDCFEYKLVGVNVHSGTANAGHYWSYINTNRGGDENDPNWVRTDDDHWMEFNDSRVSDFQFKNLKEECFGDENTGSGNSWGFGNYGKSGYMLFYERRIKKPIKILVPEGEADALFDEKNKEHYKLIPFKECAADEAPNKIYQQVFEDNRNFTFENDVYSVEFESFVKLCLKNVVELSSDCDEEAVRTARRSAIEVAKIAALQILARCYKNEGLKTQIDAMIEIFKQDPIICKEFVIAILDDRDGEFLFEMILDCTDQVARTNAAHLFKFLVCRLKEVEKDDLLSGAQEQVSKTVVNAKGEPVVHHFKQPKAVSARMILTLLSVLNTRAAKAWAVFDCYLEILHSFGVHSSYEVEHDSTQHRTRPDKWDCESEAAMVGLEFYFRMNMIEKIGDFLLQDQSPMPTEEPRVTMRGTLYSKTPNFESFVSLLTSMLSHKNLIAKYPLSAMAQQMIQHDDLLDQIVSSATGSPTLVEMIETMAKDNYKMTKKLAKVFIKAMNASSGIGSSESAALKTLKPLKRFLKINDSFKQNRLEWIFGVPQINWKTQYGGGTLYGIERIERINDEAYTYNSSLSASSTDDALLTKLIAQKTRGAHDFCMRALKDLLLLCNKDDDICRYLYKSPPPTFQFARFCDWFKDYLVLKHEENVASNLGQYKYHQERLALSAKIVGLLPAFEEKCAKLAAEEEAEMTASLAKGEFGDVRQSWMAYEHEEVIKHFPPQFIPGKQVGDARLIKEFEDENVLVKLFEIENEFIFSNPTGQFNLSCPEKLVRFAGYPPTFCSYAQYKEQSAKAQAEESKDTAAGEDAGGVSIVTKDWIENHSIATVLLAVKVVNKANTTVKGCLQFEGNANFRVPKTPFAFTLYINDSSTLAVFLKTNTNEDTWGDFTLKFHSKEAFKSSSGTKTGSYAQMNMQPQSVSASTETQYETYPVSYDAKESSGSVAFNCRFCDEKNYVGMSFCSGCGEALEDGSVSYGPNLY